MSSVSSHDAGSRRACLDRLVFARSYQRQTAIVEPYKRHVAEFADGTVVIYDADYLRRTMTTLIRFIGNGECSSRYLGVAIIE